MGLREKLEGRRVYFDANIFIYLLEGYKELEWQIEEIRSSLVLGECEIFTSELTLCEILVYPLGNQDNNSVEQYRAFLERSGAFQLIPTSKDTYIRASEYRALLRLRTPDAIHVATALESECDIFLTNDRNINIAGLNIELVHIGRF
uniref:Predicted nucleic acid-binding protein, contains PIN domain n=1 Tax=Candidatus Kentrum sp. DK TaxID=2126562 RepID=A0A450S6X0_9GAMM|nr:MAG: Predicted nucleic acid-binding protein, contains PIN domain [Candidatus Kentron sp. DK]VFJ47603.1 MAG: Predicted nucleic acid-binding protein, contains PIN domain [Candidatus Kentron sp. DK]